jgi:CRISPR/Cas system CMR-associated protein Cmr3 (group 5 of RAMP superfamily)
MEGVAALLSQGKTLEHVSIDTALDMGYLHTLVNSKEFQKTFKLLDPEAFAAWEETRQDVESKRLVKSLKSLARADAVDNYKLARDIIRTGELSDKDRLQGLFKMLDISGTAGDDVVEETVQLSQANLKNIAEAMRETAGD